MNPNDSIGPEQLRSLLGAPRKRRAEDILSHLGSSRPAPSAGHRPDRPQPSAQQPGPMPQDAAAQHDGALRNHLAGLVRALMQAGETKRLRELLVEHRDFIDGIISVLEGKNPP